MEKDVRQRYHKKIEIDQELAKNTERLRTGFIEELYPFIKKDKTFRDQLRKYLLFLKRKNP